jgi:hypothetical protein
VLIGETGSGKSLALFMMLKMLCQQHRCEVLILEREAVDWNYNSAVLTIDGYLDALKAVEVERQRRADMLRAADVKHISDLPNPPPYLAVVVEEAESVYSEFTMRSREQAKEYAVTLGNLARLARKEGILLFVTTQTGTSGVFDIPTRKQFGNRYIFRSEPQVGDSWGIARDYVLPKLKTGTAYSINHGELVTFPLVQRPSLPLSKLYREPDILALPADAEADGLGADDMPSTKSYQLGERIKLGPNDVAISVDKLLYPDGIPANDWPRPATAYQQTVDPLHEKVRRGEVIEPPTGTDPQGWPAWMVQEVYDMWTRNARSGNETQRNMFGYKGGQAYYVVAACVNEALRRRGKPAFYNPKEG